MTKVKVKAAFVPKPSPSSEDEDKPPQNFMPFGKVSTKRKRGPRGSVKNRSGYSESPGFQHDAYSDSALATSSSDGNNDNDDEIASSAQILADARNFGASDSPSFEGPRRGSVRLKVKPSKFREDTSSDAMPDAKSPTKRKSAGSIHERNNLKQPLTDELNAALMVVQKVMKMEAAEPFNIPVDPIALGIPDYFDIVKRPMDLGTICKNLERGWKYRNSRDVYEDVQLVWTNCRIYNRKGDPILDLLSKVKKNFMKHWVAAGLYTEKSPVFVRLEGKTSESPQLESDISTVKQQLSYEGIDTEKNKKMVKVAKEAENAIEPKLKNGEGYVDKHTTESDNARLLLDLGAGRFQRDPETVASILNDDFDSYLQNREGPKIISVYRAYKRRKKLEQQDDANERNIQSELPRAHEHEDLQKLGDQGESVSKHSKIEEEPKPMEHESLVLKPTNSKDEEETISEVPGTIVFKSAGANRSQTKKDLDSSATPGKTKRVSGTGHHKPDCSCVVCIGVRRKLAREGKLGPEAVGGTPFNHDRLLLRVKAEGSGDELKIRVAKERKDIKTRDLTHERFNISEHSDIQESSKKVTVNETEMQNPKSDEINNGHIRNNNGAMEGSLAEHCKDNPAMESKPEVESRGPIGEEEEDAGQNDEHFADPADVETERQEGGVKYYRANYEMPLRKVNPSLLQMGKKLYGNDASWKNGLSLAGHSRSNHFDNPILTTVSVLLGGKGT